MIKTKLSIAKMPCDCNTVCGIETFDWHIVVKDNIYWFRLHCKVCQKFVESKAMASIVLEPDTLAEETSAILNKKIPTTIWEAKENLNKYLASLSQTLEDEPSLKKEYVH